MPRLYGCLTTCAPAASATSAVRSFEPSSTTTASNPGSAARISAITPAIESSSLNAGITASRCKAAMRESTFGELGAAICSRCIPLSVLALPELQPATRRMTTDSARLVHVAKRPLCAGRPRPRRTRMRPRCRLCRLRSSPRRDPPGKQIPRRLERMPSALVRKLVPEGRVAAVERRFAAMEAAFSPLRSRLRLSGSREPLVYHEPGAVRAARQENDLAVPAATHSRGT